jgi:hypothetical protein
MIYIFKNRKAMKHYSKDSASTGYLSIIIGTVLQVKMNNFCAVEIFHKNSTILAQFRFK